MFLKLLVSLVPKWYLDVVVNAAFFFFETSKLWVLFMYILYIDGKPKD